MAQLAAQNLTRFLRYGVGLVLVFVVIAAGLVWAQLLSGDALVFFMGTVIGYLFALFARQPTASTA